MQDLLLPIKTITLEGCGASWGILPRGPCLTLAPALPASVAPRLGRQLPDSGIEHSHWKQLGNHYVLFNMLSGIYSIRERELRVLCPANLPQHYHWRWQFRSWDLSPLIPGCTKGQTRWPRTPICVSTRIMM